MEKASVIIPAFNEALRIEKTIKSLQGIAEVSEIIVVDDGSGDNTGQLAERAGAKVIRLPFNVGKGGAMARGLEAARENLVVFLDADLEETAAEAVKLIEPVLRGEADLVVAHWQHTAPRPRGGFGLVVSLARWGIKKITGFEAQSPLSGQRAAIKAYLGNFEAGYGVEVGMTIDC
ncbi:MAG TPA: glycosyltransferase family 2 protein, partial [Firmicutes bacterium]|nr:glycosyltransferase family 2 protein [Bacillota bacterium]